MSKRLLCYDTENSVGVNDGVLDPNAIGGGIDTVDKYSTMIDQKMYLDVNALPAGQYMLMVSII